MGNSNNFTIKSLPNYLSYPMNEIPLENIFLSCAKFNMIRIFEKPMTSHKGGYTLRKKKTTLFSVPDQLLFLNANP